MRVWRAADRVSEPWKNGAGTMAVILTSPGGTDWDRLDWRVSTAVITRSAPFSHFPGLDRLFTPYQGGTVTLRLPGQVQKVTPGDAPFAFSGEAECYCDHDGAETLVLNLQTRAPYRAAAGYDASVWEGAPVACYLFALEAMGDLAAFDLVEVKPTDCVPTGRALFVAINKISEIPVPTA
ncbi:hypothetical protein P775_25180 [Puniceibacterium antarcticum]|uniref:HutD-family protein n=1 Tax=Puniceibacterium antarcticum TaxID=1206336 RepID=A0A2G8R3Y9_9RHOB|nr:HutD family protein [Puniceibacterium antarcticum]PIL16257.1 hypothetical protein P775_25180 [Puniceibacterium antarcticum]